MKIYYAHSKAIYGTQREKEELCFLKLVFDVVDPNNDMGERGNIKYYLEAINKCDLVICSEYQDFIGKGVFQEIDWAIKNNKPVLCMRPHDKTFLLSLVKDTKIHDVTDWHVKYGKLTVY